METDTHELEQLHAWHMAELRRLEFTHEQRAVLLDLIDDGEVELADVRDLIERRGWTPEQAFLSVA